MNQIRETLSGFLLGLGAYAVLIEGIGFFFSGDFAAYTFGLLLGIAIAVVLFLHMAKTLDYALDRSPDQAAKYVKRQSLLRLFVMLVGMIVGLLVDRMNFITVVLGMLGLKTGALIAPCFLKRIYPDQYGTKPSQEVDVESP